MSGSRVISIDRLFSLGDFRNIKISESVEVPIDTPREDLYRVRKELLLDVYERFALHQELMNLLKESGIDPDNMLQTIQNLREEESD